MGWPGLPTLLVASSPIAMMRQILRLFIAMALSRAFYVRGNEPPFVIKARVEWMLIKALGGR